MTNPTTAAARRTREVLICASAAALLAGGAAALPALPYLLPPWLTGEGDRLATALGLGPGMTVADVGAGKGAMTMELTRHVGSSGRVYATELAGAALERLRRRVSAQGRTQVTVVMAGEKATNLPDGCCDAILLRAVYHHIGDPEAYAASLRRALKPGGRLAVVDFPPGSFWHLRRPPDGASAVRSGHGIAVDRLVAEMQNGGFVHVQTVQRWMGRLYLAVFRLPESHRVSTPREASPRTIAAPGPVPPATAATIGPEGTQP